MTTKRGIKDQKIYIPGIQVKGCVRCSYHMYAEVLKCLALLNIPQSKI